jgi:hypothetical protein
MRLLSGTDTNSGNAMPYINRDSFTPEKEAEHPGAKNID